MKRLGTVLVLVCGLSFTAAFADTIIGPDATVAVTNSEALGSDPVQLKTGAILVFPGADAGVAGLNEYTRTAATSVGTPYLNPYGTFTRIIDNAYWATNKITDANTEYVYTGRWYLPQAGLYSFYEHIDDHAALGIDGQVVFRNTVYNQPTCVQDIPLEAGWHGVEVRVFNGWGGGGAASGLLSGILFSPSNDLISVENQTNAFAFADPGDGGVLRAAHNGHLGQKILVEGTAVLNLADHDMAQPFRLLGGLLQLTNTTGAACRGQCGRAGLRGDRPRNRLSALQSGRGLQQCRAGGVPDLPRPGHAVRLAHLLHLARGRQRHARAGRHQPARHG